MYSGGMRTAHIVGGGVSGLALAGFLSCGWDVHLHEADWDARPVPTLFGIQTGGRRALEALGLGAALRRESLQISEGLLRDGAGRVLARVRGADVQLIPRPVLIGLLRDRLPSRVSVHRRTVATSRDLAGDLIVGADGVHSLIRQEHWRRSGARPLPVTVLRGVIDADLSEHALQEIWRADGLFGITPRPGGGVNWFATVPRQRFAGRDEALDALRARWDQGPAGPAEVLRHADAENTLVNDLWESRWPGRLVRGHAVLIGDAAHAMAPNLGRGANESLVDALVLGRALTAGATSRALRRYESTRLISPQLLRRASRTMLGVATTRHERLRSAAFAPLPKG
ncbi:hypothetical protein GCM10027079_14700 [Sediminivirga luteola]|uniref:FAD-binding domain-containing protein n=2 Tax=Sediminivirga luteola TaxID=1774748 RepID=A0A8J2TV53_9MICO|nr:hypothetical protein GCM10011333_02150 [Sediminivirga luteola]